LNDWDLTIKRTDLEKAEAQLSAQITKAFASSKCPIDGKPLDITLTLKIESGNAKVEHTIRACCEQFKEKMLPSVQKFIDEHPVTMKITPAKPNTNQP